MMDPKSQSWLCNTIKNQIEYRYQIDLGNPVVGGYFKPEKFISFWMYLILEWT